MHRDGLQLMKSLVRQRLRRRLQTPTRIRRPNPRNIRDDDDLISSLGHCHRLVMSGHSLDSAITVTAFSHPSREIRAVYALMADGESLESACRQLIDLSTDQKSLSNRERDALIALHVLSFAGSIGGRVAEHLEALLVVLNDRVHLREERASQASQAAMSMKMLTSLPVVCGAWMIVDSAEIRAFLFETVAGWTCLIFGIGLNLLGRWWLRREVLAC